METNRTNKYQSFSPVHPFEIVEDEIDARGLTKKEFAESIGMKPSNFSRMIRNKGALTSDMALKLECALGIPFSHWMKYQEEYLKDCTRLNVTLKDAPHCNESSQNVKVTGYEDLYTKVAVAIRPIRERLEKINALILSRDSGNQEYISKDQIESIENDIHSLGKSLCELRLSK